MRLRNLKLRVLALHAKTFRVSGLGFGAKPYNLDKSHGILTLVHLEFWFFSMQQRKNSQNKESRYFEEPQTRKPNFHCSRPKDSAACW